MSLPRTSRFDGKVKSLAMTPMEVELKLAKAENRRLKLLLEDIEDVLPHSFYEEGTDRCPGCLIKKMIHREVIND